MEMTFRELKMMVVANGFKVSAASCETDDMVYACSVECHPGTYHHPKFVAALDKRTGWVSITGKKSFKI